MGNYSTSGSFVTVCIWQYCVIGESWTTWVWCVGSWVSRELARDGGLLRLMARLRHLCFVAALTLTSYTHVCVTRMCR